MGELQFLINKKIDFAFIRGKREGDLARKSKNLRSTLKLFFFGGSDFGLGSKKNVFVNAIVLTPAHAVIFN